MFIWVKKINFVPGYSRRNLASERASVVFSYPLPQNIVADAMHAQYSYVWERRREGPKLCTTIFSSYELSTYGIANYVVRIVADLRKRNLVLHHWTPPKDYVCPHLVHKEGWQSWALLCKLHPFDSALFVTNGVGGNVKAMALAYPNLLPPRPPEGPRTS